jgi:hypothetical protein
LKEAGKKEDRILGVILTEAEARVRGKDRMAGTDQLRNLSRRLRNKLYVDAQKSEIPKTAERPDERKSLPGFGNQLRRIRSESSGTLLDDQ